LISPSQKIKKVETVEAPQIEDSMERWSVSPFGPPIWVRRGGLWAKHKGLKQGTIGNTLGKHIGNLKNILRTKEK
jgi:hypothetical protein